MGETSRQIRQVQIWIDRLQAGDRTARDELIGYADERLRRLTRKMLKGYARVKRWEDTDDVLHNALLRLWKALHKIVPRSPRHFFALAALQIRRELIDLARQYYGPEGMGAKHSSTAQRDSSASMPRAARADSTLEPSRLAIWSEFHERVGTLPEEEREVFDLLWYQELTQSEAAALLDISEATLKRRWLAARRRLHQALKGELPGT
jgi:RNA polymerase sigma-70 factor (ECF subfamily)